MSFLKLTGKHTSYIYLLSIAHYKSSRVTLYQIIAIYTVLIAYGLEWTADRQSDIDRDYAQNKRQAANLRCATHVHFTSPLLHPLFLLQALGQDVLELTSRRRQRGISRLSPTSVGGEMHCACVPCSSPT